MLELTGPGLALDAADCALLGPQLREALRLAYAVRRQQPPRAIAAFTAAVNRSARCRTEPQATGAPGTVTDRSSPDVEASWQPVRLSIREAAALAQCSEGYMRRMARSREVLASRGCRGWAVDIASLGAWISVRRTELDRKAAA